MQEFDKSNSHAKIISVAVLEISKDISVYFFEGRTNCTPIFAQLLLGESVLLELPLSPITHAFIEDSKPI